MKGDRKKLKFSVIIPARNAARTLAACLEAVLAAQPAPTEVIVVNDASEDDTAEIASRYPCRILDVDLRQGPMQPRMAAVPQAQHPVLVFVDADVVIEPDAFARIAQHFRNTGVHAVTGRLHPQAGRGFFSRYKNAYMHFIFSRQPRDASFLYGSIWAIRKSDFVFFEPITQPWGSLVSDSEMGLELKRRRKKIVLDHDLVVRHLKEYSFGTLLQNDFRIPFLFALMFLKYEGPSLIPGKNFSHSSFTQVCANLCAALGLSANFMALLGAGSVFLWVSLLFFGVGFALWFSFLHEIRKNFSTWFLIRTIFFIPVDGLVMFAGMAAGFVYGIFKMRSFSGLLQKREMPHA